MNDDSPVFKDIKPKPKPKPEAGLVFDSDEERWAWWLLEELVEIGSIRKVERAPTLELFPPLRLANRSIFLGHSYTADFKITWNLESSTTKKLTAEPSDTSLSAPPIFWRTGSESLIEVKPCFDAHNKTQLANINLKWVLQRHGFLVQLIRVGQGERSFFSSAWTPDKFRITGTGRDRKLNYRLVRSLGELLESIQA